MEVQIYTALMQRLTTDCSSGYLISTGGHIDCFVEMVLNFHILATVSFLEQPMMSLHQFAIIFSCPDGKTG